MQTLLHIIQGGLAIIITFGLAVFVHEFGHMIFALMRGVAVDSFAIGMGPIIKSWHWHGIEFSLRWFPLGGFVKIRGMMMEDEEEEKKEEKTEAGAEKPSSLEKLGQSAYDDALALSNKGTVTKLLVFGGGVFMNYVTAIVAMVLALLYPVKVDRLGTDVEQVIAGRPAEAAGLKAGDKVIEVAGKPVQWRYEYFEALDAALKKADTSKTKAPAQVTLEVERAGQRVAIPVDYAYDAKAKAYQAGFVFFTPAYVDRVIPTFPAHKAGIKHGDVIVAVNGQPIHSFNEVSDLMSGSLGREMQFEVKRNDKILQFKLTPKEDLDDPTKGLVDILPGTPDKMSVRQETNPLRALALAPVYATDRLVSLATQTFSFFRHATPRQLKDNLGGPLMIFGVTAKAAEGGFGQALNWFITLNLLLLIFNLLPLPVLDGGFLLLSLIEGVIRRPVPPKILTPIYTAFVIFFITLMVLVTALDVYKWFF